MDISKLLSEDRISIIKSMMGSDYNLLLSDLSATDDVAKAKIILFDWVEMYGLITVAFSPSNSWK